MNTWIVTVIYNRYSYRVLLVSRVSSGATVHSRKSPAHTAGEKRASEATIYSQKVLINASESVYTLHSIACVLNISLSEIHINNLKVI